MKPFIKLSISIVVKGFFFVIAWMAVIWPVQIHCAQSHYSYNDQVKNCYRQISSLRLGEAEKSLQILKNQQASNLALVHMENYIDFFYLFVTEEEDRFKQMIDAKAGRIKALDLGPTDSPYHKFVKAEVLLQYAVIRLKFDEKIMAASEIYEAYRLLEQNKKDFPQFAENDKSLSIIYALAESIPSWMRKVGGVKGSVDLAQQGIEKLSKKAHNPEYFFREEVVAIYTYLLFYQFNQKEKAQQQFSIFEMNHRKNPLIAFLKASIYTKSGRNEECIKVLSEAPKGSEYLAFYFLDFLMGKALLRKLDPEANKFLKSFVHNFKGRHYIREAYQKLAWYELIIHKNSTKYSEQISLCLKYGHSLLDEDIQATKEAKAGKIPEPELLKARLMFDGGEYLKAQHILESYSLSAQSSQLIKEEYYYRIGRIYQEQELFDKALKSFQVCMTTGSKSWAYYACASALQSGIIYEAMGDRVKALSFYEQCLKLKPSDYRKSLHQKAKSGILRVGS
jgi:predicted negative regulator of RcsB-dependent stress response